MASKNNDHFIQLTPEQEKLIPAHVEEWRKIAYRTTPQTDADRKQFTEGMVEFYKQVKLPTLSPELVLFRRSPTEARIVAGLLSASLYMIEKGVGDKGLFERTLKYVENLPTVDPEFKKGDPRWGYWCLHFYDAKRIRSESTLEDWGATCVLYASRMWHGGNMDVSAETFDSFVQKHLPDQMEKLRLDRSAWDPWVRTVTTGGGRFMHTNFVVASDFPTVLTVDAQGRAHGDNAPHAQWSDGMALFHHNGVRVPAWIKAHPEQLRGQDVMNESNAEVRRAMLEIMSPAKFIQDVDAQIVHQDADMYDRPRRLLKVAMPPPEEDVVMVEVTNSTAEPDGTFRKYLLRVDPNAYAGAAGRNCQAAIASTWRKKAPGLPLMFNSPEDYVLQVET